MGETMRIAAVAVSGLLFWAAASLLLGVAEPWDSRHYWFAYAVALGLSGLFGFFFRHRAWRWGVMVIFAQLPVMWLQTGIGSLLPVGIVLLAILSLPAIGAAIALSKLEIRPKP